MSAPESHADFLGARLDLTTDSFTEEEKALTLAWYREVHDHGDLDLAPFSRFLLEHDPVGFKRLRRHLNTLDDAVDGARLPIAAGVLMFVHTYIVLGMGKGALYEIVAMRKLGASRAEIMETVRLAGLHGGPRGINALAEVADDYFREWQEEPNAPSRVCWPAGWAPDRDRFRSGIDLDSDELEPGELELIRDWYRGILGEVPRQIDVLGRLAPRALKTQRARYETAITGALPAQMIPLLTLHLGAVRLWPTPLRRAVQTAKALGVGRGQVVAALFWAGVYGADVVLETAVDAVGDLLEEWR